MVEGKYPESRKHPAQLWALQSLHVFHGTSMSMEGRQPNPYSSLEYTLYCKASKPPVCMDRIEMGMPSSQLWLNDLFPLSFSLFLSLQEGKANRKEGLKSFQKGYIVCLLKPTSFLSCLFLKGGNLGNCGCYCILLLRFVLTDFSSSSIYSL
jgi:hypothetical protein